MSNVGRPARIMLRSMLARHVCVTIPVFLAILLSICGTPIAYATRGLTTTGVVLVTNVIPGQTLDHKITVNVGDEDSPTDIAVAVASMGQAADGAYMALDQFSDDSANSARSFITLDRDSFSLKPGETQELIATVRVPQTVGEGGKYALINIQTKGSGQSTVGVSSAVNIPVYLTVANSHLVHTGRIAKILVIEPDSGKPIDVTTSFQNTGNHHFKVRGEVAIVDPGGRILDTIHYTPTGPSIIPGMTRILKVTFIPQGQLPVGQYSVKSKVTLEDGNVIDEATSEFEVKEAYVPPPPPAEITLKPTIAGLLATGDGRISVSFPKGAVISEANIALRSCPPQQLPTPPASLKLAATSFRLEGLNGLLAKSSTVQVRYTQADLQTAESDASKLVLARWDESSDTWVILRTSVDKQATTLTAVTNQLGTWAVMAKGSRPTAAPWTQIGMVAGIAAVCLVVVFAVSKKRRAH